MIMFRFRRLLTPLAGLALVAAVCAWKSSPAKETEQHADPPPPKLAEQFRKPIALAWVEPSKLVAVANGRSGTISIVDVPARRVVSETKVAERLADLAESPNSRKDYPGFFAALDGKSHELLYLQIKVATVEIIGRLRVGDDPRKVVVAADERTAVVACGWSRRLDIVEVRVEAGTRDPANWNRAFPRLVRSVELPFAPQELLLTTIGDADAAEGPRLVVAADAYGGRLAVVDVEKGSIVALRTIAGRNIRGLSLDDDATGILIAYQRADGKQSTTETNLRSGRLAMNLVGRISLAKLLAAKSETEPLELEEMHLDVGTEAGTTLGAADPDDVAPIIEGVTVVLLSGTGQLAAFGFGDERVSRHAVGTRPTALLLDPQVRRMIVANSLDDTLSILEQEPATISLGPRPELWPRDQGERLFFDGRRSLGGFMSCHSCHPDGHTAGGLADTLGDGTYGTPKRIPTLLGSSITDPWGWNGGLRELRDQVDQSMRTSMHDPHYRSGDVDDLTAYLHTLQFPPPLIAKPRDEDDERLVAAGRAIFARERCAECHIGPLTFTSPAAYDVGPRDERGLAKFNPPSLRGIGHGVAFFHDARAHSLEELFRKERHQLSADLSAEELRALVRYLQGL